MRIVYKNNFKWTGISLLIWALSTITMVAQELPTVTYKKWSVGISFSPDYSYRTLKAESSYRFIKNRRDGEEISKPGFTTGITLLWRANPRLELESGILLSNKGYKTRTIALQWIGAANDFPSSYKVAFRYHYLEVPVKLNYHFNFSKLSLFVTTGLSGNYFIREQIKLSLYQSNGSVHSEINESDLGFSTFSITLLTGIGATYAVNDRVQVRLQPLYRKTLTTLTGAKGLQERLFSLGVEIGVVYKLKK